ncbi:MAG: translesion error-prone DNA polymerase V autoproteolytic subunit [Ferruginibacter sp.]
MTIFRVVGEESPIAARYAQSVAAGFPSPAADYAEEEINFNTLLMPHPNATFVMRVQGDSMVEANIPDNSLIVVDRSIKPSNNMIVVAIVNGEITVKRFIKNSSGVRLMPANAKFKPLPITEEMDFRVWGTVTKIIIDALTV